MEFIIGIVKLLFYIAIFYFLFIWPIKVILQAIKRNSDRRYELERYKAETERMRAEAEAGKSGNSGDNNQDM